MALTVKSLAAVTTVACLNFPTSLSKPKPNPEIQALQLNCKPRRTRSRIVLVSAKGGDNNRKPLQKGRNLSIEAIQTVQALKRAYNNNSLENVLCSKFSRLLKLDMIAVLRELLRQNHCLLALQIFEIVRMEDWYKPQFSLYVEMITVMASNGFLDKVELLYMHWRTECHLEADNEGFNALLTTLIGFNVSRLVMDCYDLMKALGCEPDRPTIRRLVNGLESIGELGASAAVRQDAVNYYGDLDFLEEEEEEEKTMVKRKWG